MILHLVEDSIIIDRVINDFEEVLPERNLFICFPVGVPKYVKERKGVSFYSKDLDYGKVIDLSHIEKVVIHYLSDVKVDFVEKYIQKNTPTYWIMWGGDYYNTLLTYRKNIYYEPWFAGWDYLLLSILKYGPVKNRIGKRKLDFIRDRVNYFLTISPEFDVFKSYYKEYVRGEIEDRFFYYPIDSIVLNEDNGNNNNNIIVGNSGSLSNNHLYAFKYLNKINLGERKIIVPISYGGSYKYRLHVINKGKKLWREKFSPITTILPLNEYNRLLASTNICVYSNWRQEAMGNLLTVLSMGHKVFLSLRNPLYKYFLDLSVRIFPLEEVDQIMFDEKLNEDDKKHNREIILEKFSKKMMHNAIAEIFG